MKKLFIGIVSLVISLIITGCLGYLLGSQSHLKDDTGSQYFQNACDSFRGGNSPAAGKFFAKAVAQNPNYLPILEIFRKAVYPGTGPSEQFYARQSLNILCSR